MTPGAPVPPPAPTAAQEFIAGEAKDDQAHGVDVRHRVERQPPEHGGCGVTPLEGRPAVGDLMQDDPEHQRHERHRQAFYGDRKVNVEHVLPYRQAQEALFAELHHVGTWFQRGFGVITAFAVKRERALLDEALGFAARGGKAGISVHRRIPGRRPVCRRPQRPS